MLSILQLDILLQTEKSRLDEERQTLEEQVAVAEKRLREIQVRFRHVKGLLGTDEAAETVLSEATNSVGRNLTDIAEEILGGSVNASRCTTRWPSPLASWLARTCRTIFA